jgi:hypothetical protein
MVDTGERLLIGTTRLGWIENERGLHNFEDVYKTRDLNVVTAARLAASFTYVSPATRTSENERPYHVVDGGYYDDYGMVTLTEWLNEALDGTGGHDSFPRVLVIQIRSDPGDHDDQPDAWHGPLYQLWAPAETLLNVRTTGQSSHNDEEFERLQQLWADRQVQVFNVVFKFCGEHPPLSWHLTGLEKAAIQQNWAAYVTDPAELGAIAAFLRGQSPSLPDPQHPLDVPLRTCPPAAPSFWDRATGGRLARP